MPGFRFKPFALIDGQLAVGYRKFDTLSRLVPDFGGVIALVDLGYTLRATRFDRPLQPRRDVLVRDRRAVLPADGLDALRWSRRSRTPGTSSGEQVATSLNYETIGLPGAERRSDSGNRYGGGIGYSLGQFVRLGFDMNYIDRQSDASVTRNYEGVRAGFTVTYGTKQR